MIQIWETDSEGSIVGTSSLLQFGKKKAKAILAHLDEIKKLAEGEE